jgi:hypothetical protein
MWLGRTLYLKTFLETFNSDTEELRDTSLESNVPLKVIKVVAGWKDDKPIRFILQADDGRTGFVDFCLSWTDISSRLRGLPNSFSDKFLTSISH